MLTESDLKEQKELLEGIDRKFNDSVEESLRDDKLNMLLDEFDISSSRDKKF